METKARSEVVVAVPFEELWDYADSSLEMVKQEVQKAREGVSHWWLRWMMRRMTFAVERFDRYKQEIQLTLTISFLSRMVMPCRVHMDAVDAETTHVLCSVETILPRGLRGWPLRKLYAFVMKHLDKGATLQGWLDSTMQDWARVIDRTYQRCGNLAPESVSETEKEIQEGHSGTEEKVHEKYSETEKEIQEEHRGTSGLQGREAVAQRSSKKRHVYFTRGLVLLALAAVATLLTFYQYFVFQSYQRGKCTILSASVQHFQGQGKKGPYDYYTFSSAYTVETKDGQHIPASGYSTASIQPQYASYEDVQAIANHYVVGETYSCWYNPANPTRAGLVLRAHPLSQAIALYFELLPIIFVLMGLTALLLYAMVYLPVRMLVKSVRTQGRVVSNFMKSVPVKGGKRVDRPYSRIVFSSQSEPARSFDLEVAGTYPIASELLVLYDPSNPEHAQQGRGGCLLVFGLVLSLFLLALLFFTLSMLVTV